MVLVSADERIVAFVVVVVVDYDDVVVVVVVDNVEETIGHRLLCIHKGEGGESMLIPLALLWKKTTTTTMNK